MRKTEDVSNSENFDHCGYCSLSSPDVGFGLLKLSISAPVGGTASTANQLTRSTYPARHLRLAGESVNYPVV